MRTTNQKLRKVLSIIICLALVMSYVPMVSFTAGAAAADITVTIDTGASVALRDADDDGYYDIGTSNELYAFVAAINAGNTSINAELTANIDLNSGYTFNSDGTVTFGGATVTSGYSSWTPIGSADIVYTGILDGANKTISGLYFNGSVEYVGFFAYMGGTVKNLNITNVYFSNTVSTSNVTAYVGGFAAYSTGSFNNCSFNGTIISNVDYVGYAGGISAYSQGDFADCVNNGTIISNTTNQRGWAGGVVGCSEGDIENCLNTGSVSGTIETYADIGGIVGEAYGEIVNSTNAGVVSGKSFSNSRVGGIAGLIHTDAIVDRCTNTADLNGESSGYATVGGIAGQSYGKVTNCSNFGDMTASTYYYVAEPAGIVGCTNGGSISYCYSVGSMTAKAGSQKYPSGIVGRIYSDTTLTSNFYCVDGASVGVGYNDTTGVDGDISGKAEGKTLEQFNNGGVAYHLQQGELSSTGNITPVWGQNVDGEGEIQSYPVWDGAIVYGSSPCPVLYSNYDGVVKNHEEYSTPCDDTCVCGYVRTDAQPHNYINGVCSMCSLYNPDNIEDGIYLISTAEQLVCFAQQVNNGNNAISAKLLNDITINADVLADDGTLNSGTFTQWTPIGYKNSEDDYINYTGVFDGQNHTIRGLYCNLERGYLGFFGRVGENGVVRNLTIEDSYFYGTECVGAIAGFLKDSATITNCHNFSTVRSAEEAGGIVGYINGTAVVISGCSNAGSVSSEKRYVGGICGFAHEATIENCYNTYSATEEQGSNYIGGICGKQEGGIVNKCYNTGNVIGGSSTIGGIVAWGYSGTVSNCYNTGNVTGGGYSIGGVCGTGRIVKNCYNTGAVKGYKQNIGGVCGSAKTVTNCYYLTGCATDYVGAVQYGLGNDTADTQTPDTEGSTTGVTLEQFASGEITYLLNGETGEGDLIWGQNIDNDKTIQKYPTFDGGTVYLLGSSKYTNFPSAIQNEAGYYEINNITELKWFAEYVNIGNLNTNAILMADIDMKGVKWTSIGSTELYYSSTYSNNDYSSVNIGYKGIFDGNGHSIKNLSITGSETETLSFGLFGTLSGTVKNLGIENLTYTGAGMDSRVGAIAGQVLYGGEISNCYVKNASINTKVNTENGVAGGIAGCNYAGTIENSFVYDITISAGRIGGIVGDNRADTEGDRLGTVNNCYTNFESVCGGNKGIETNSKHSLSEASFTKGSVTWYLNEQSANGIWKQNGKLPGFTGTAVDQSVLSTYEQPEIKDSVYQIANKSQFFWFAEYVNFTDTGVDAVLVNDIDLANEEWVPIGYFGNSYSGTFDGQGYSITNFKMTITGTRGVGLFGDITNATVRNFNVYGEASMNYSFRQPSFYGVVGASNASTLNGIKSYVNLTVNDSYMKNNVAGIVGYISTSTIEKCAFYGTIDLGNAPIDCGGGIVAYGNYNNSHVINNCAFYGTIHSDNENSGQLGGIIGYYRGSNIVLRNCLSVGTMDIENTTFTGMLGGRVLGLGSSNLGSIANNYFYKTKGIPDFSATTDYTYSDIEPSDYSGYGVANAKSVAAIQLASGEVAYLLQQGNTEQVWGQLSNTAGSVPVFTDNTLYAVAEKECGGYSVASIGDINEDGIVDVNDYQRMVNMVVADESDISAVEEIRGDMDGDGYIDVLDASMFASFVNGKVNIEIYAPGDFDGDGVVSEEDISNVKAYFLEDKSLTKAQQFACDLNGDGAVDVFDRILANKL